jgi:hypothetical protein
MNRSAIAAVVVGREMPEAGSELYPMKMGG